MFVAGSNNELSIIRFLLQEIQSIIETRRIGDIEPDDDEITLIAEYQERKKNRTLIVDEL